MRRTRLTAFHAVMGAVYLLIIWAYETGHVRLSLTVLWAAFTACMAILAGCAFILLTAWRSSGQSFLGWFRHQLQEWRIGRADGSPPGSAQQLDLESTDVRVVSGMGDEPGRLAGLGAADDESQGTEPGVDGSDRLPLAGECAEGE
jgi:hypothetical protein